MDLLVERRIATTPARLAATMFDPDNDPRWIGGAKSVERLSADPSKIGARVRRTGGFLGRKFSSVTETVAFEPERRLEMRFVEGPMRGAVAYEVRPDGEGAVAGVHNRGEASFSIPGMAWMLRRSVAADLKRLAALVETGA